MITFKIVRTVLYHNSERLYCLFPAFLPNQKISLLQMHIRSCRIQSQRLVIIPKSHTGVSLLFIHHPQGKIKLRILISVRLRGIQIPDSLNEIPLQPGYTAQMEICFAAFFVHKKRFLKNFLRRIQLILIGINHAHINIQFHMMRIFFLRFLEILQRFFHLSCRKQCLSACHILLIIFLIHIQLSFAYLNFNPFPVLFWQLPASDLRSPV